MNIAVVGAGSMGLLLCGKLSQVSGQITIITRTSEQARSIAAHGIRVTEDELPFDSFPKATYSHEEMHNRAHLLPYQLDWVFVAVKQRDLDEQFVRFISSILQENTNLLCFQNGLGHVEKFSEHIPPGQIYVAVTTEGARRDSLRSVAHTGRGHTLIGQTGHDIAGATAHKKNVCLLLNDAGFPTTLSNNMNSILWEKLLINSVINPLTALLGVRNGELLHSKQSVELMQRLFAEGVEVARSIGIDPPADLWHKLIAVCQNTANNDSSMLQDLRNRRETELESITGKLIDFAEKASLCIPTHRTIYNLVKVMERK